ncbi:MAG: leucine-rich repeat protein, partial [Eubacterium sp.]|nr:leucine-rich repeat protein [Eubacterium sp.]
EMQHDDSGNVVSTTTTTTTKEPNGTETVTQVIEYTNTGVQELRSVKIETNGNVTVTEQTSQLNGDYVKTVTAEVGGKPVTIDRINSTNDQIQVMTFSVSSSGNLTLKTIGSEASKEKLVVPATVTANGVTYPVTSIAKGAFKNRSKLKSAKIGSNVTSIGASAFEKATGMTKMSIGSGVSKIGAKACKGAKRLSRVDVYSTHITGIGKKAFDGIAPDVVFYIAGSKKEFNATKKKLKAAGAPKGAKYRRM